MQAQETRTASVLPPFFAELSLDDLAVWAGAAVFQRGIAYYRAGRVHDVALTPEGGLLATVDGTRRYATLLLQGADGNPASSCTCPYGERCKHAVALACACPDLAAANRSLPSADAGDKRLLDLETAEFPDEASRRMSDADLQALEAKLQKNSKEELVALVLNAVRLAPEVAGLCAAAAGNATSPKDGLTLLKDARKALRKASEVPDWDDYRRNSDYAPVRKKLEVLRLAGFAEEVLELGLELIEDGARRIEMCDDEGETQDDIAQCMPVVLHALRDVDQPLHKKLLWAAVAILTDEFAVCECFWDILHEKHAPEAWSPVADALMLRVEQCGKESYSRGQLLDLTAYALGSAGREAELRALYTREAVECGDYLRLVKYLLEKGDDGETEEWIHKGIVAAERNEPYIQDKLRACLLDLRKKQEDWDAALCMQTENFVRYASLERFKECRGSADKLGVWPVLRPLLTAFLTERTLPWEQDAWPCRNRGGATVFRGEKKHPDFGTLIDVAIYEKNPADVLKWYDLQGTVRYGFGYDADRVAAAVQDFAPERSVALWKKLAEERIDLTKVRAYAEASVFLRKMKNLMGKQGMIVQWNAYIQSLRVAHRRKIRLMEVLDALASDGKPSVRGGRDEQ
jgi:uncharacterized Zn finger protein